MQLSKNLSTVGMILLLWCLNATSFAEDSCVFRHQPFAAGELSNQTVRCDLSLEMAIRQGDQTIDSSNQEVRREQQRQIKIVEMGAKAPVKAIVTYKTSAVMVQQADARPMTSSQPVSGKSYEITRVGEALSIKTLDGQTPPANELALLKANLEAFGLPNPIATFFDGKSMKVGQSVDLPIELAKELLGFQDGVGNVTSLKMTLTKILDTKSGKLAVFDTQLIARQNQDGVSITLNGQLGLEVDSCRTAVVNLAGPVAVDEVRGSKDGQFQVNSTGQLKVAVRATYQAAR
ncbi:MAG: hypothetical protein KDB27_06690 [Planctomycetales bacterium]|nr:hypothetical protein [Planctomycetales bacterium]